ncbi:hypothetical protein PLICRDRAFT_119051 [Plicaturopsis crispa FD-325 SS-3]|uniref:Major facilitator superfamily (MFS) profile domain-containing protein n=1 Tax=Plicaturopsis crispa FD-325 SS-3 TaxID=944288 RepID=A0A0C9SQH7_PLICR|nr:hypothetical protein PLICRDRAFT_119051 [Plicaturopsis crispa FD-325 SS-3]
MLAPPIPSAAIVNPPPAQPAARKYFLLAVFCLAQFLDAFNNASLFSAIPSMIVDLDMTESQSTWLISAFQLTFASFLLISGRISDVYNPKTAFIGGVAALGAISLIAGFLENKIAIIVMRAMSGIAAAMTIPSALALLVSVFPDHHEQARAISIFGGSGAVGNVLGLFLGAIFVQYASWHWVFWFLALATAPIAVICFYLVPAPQQNDIADGEQGWAKFKSLDLVGVSILTAALVLFIYAVTSASAAGWVSAMVLAPLIVSIIMIVAFFYWETLVPSDKAAVPPRTWFYPNFAVLFAAALLPYLWWTTVFTVFTTLWQDVYHWAAISSAARMVPLAALAFAISFTGPLSRRISTKWLIMVGQCGMVIATVLLAFADGSGMDTYFSFTFPAFIIGSAGAMLSYSHTNIAIFRTSPASMAGTVGAIFNGALQLGSAVGIAAVTSIESSVEATHGGFTAYNGRRAAFFFLLAIVLVEFAAVAWFYRIGGDIKAVDTSVSGVSELGIPDLGYENKTADPAGCTSAPSEDRDKEFEKYMTVGADEKVSVHEIV